MFVLLSAASVFSFLSCAANDEHEKPRRADELFSFSYSRQGTEAYGRSYSVTRDGESALVEIRLYEDVYRFTADVAIFAELQSVIDSRKMYRYKASYKPVFQVLDGDSWGLDVSYADASLSFSSHGSNAWPKDGRETFREITDCFEALIKKYHPTAARENSSI